MEKEIEKEYDGYEIYRDYEKSRRKYALKQMFKIKNINMDIKSDYNAATMYFYWLKAVICLILNKKAQKDFGIFIVTYDEYQCMESYSWEYVSVGEGFFKGWAVIVGTDGT